MMFSGPCLAVLTGEKKRPWTDTLDVDPETRDSRTWDGSRLHNINSIGSTVAQC